MYNILLKYKRIVFLLIKLVIIGCAFYFIHQKLISNELLSFQDLQQQLSILFSKNGWYLLLLLLFTDANWLLEIYKWQLLATVEQKTTFHEAYEQSLASLTSSIITPNRIGEYAVKALYFKKDSRKKIIALNFIGNLSQLTATIIFGIIGFIFIFLSFDIHFPPVNIQKMFIAIAIVSILYYVVKLTGISKIVTIQLKKAIAYLEEVSFKFYIKILVISAVRYLIFSHQFYFLLRLFEIETNYFTLINLIFCSYFIASILPSLAIFDWALKGSIAVFMFNFIGLNVLTIITVTTIMWLLNVAIPALLGSIFVLNFNFPKNE